MMRTRRRNDTAIILHVLDGIRTHAKYAFDFDIVRIGRDRSSSIVLPDDSVSRLHARIERNDTGGFWLIDHTSSNGTYVNGYPRNEKLLEHGDKLQIGRFTIAVEILSHEPIAPSPGRRTDHDSPTLPVRA